MELCALQPVTDIEGDTSSLLPVPVLPEEPASSIPTLQSQELRHPVSVTALHTWAHYSRQTSRIRKTIFYKLSYWKLFNKRLNMGIAILPECHFSSGTCHQKTCWGLSAMLVQLSICRKSKVSLLLPNKESLSGRGSSLGRTHMSTTALKTKTSIKKTLKVKPRAQMYIRKSGNVYLLCFCCLSLDPLYYKRWSEGIRHPGG